MGSEDKSFKKICKLYKKYGSSDGLTLINKAYELAKVAYYKEFRFSKISFLQHSLNVALYCAKYNLDSKTISAAILHDTFNFGVTEFEVTSYVDAEVGKMLTNLEDIKTIRNRYNNLYLSEKTLYSDYLRRLIIILGKDFRVIILRLLEKYDSLKDCEYLTDQKKSQVIKNMLDIYAPLAEFLGLHRLKQKMEDLAFKKKSFKKYLKYKNFIKKSKYSNKNIIGDFEKKLKLILLKNNVDFVKVYGRKKGVYSFYKKVNRYVVQKKLTTSAAVNAIRDKIAFSIITKNVDDCYKVFGLINNSFKVLHSQTDDYIVKPKSNGYKAIHLIIELKKNLFVEIQIKTNEMHKTNEYGVASHAYYKMYGSNSVVNQNKIMFLQNLINWKDLISRGETNIKSIQDTILSITPKGDVIELPNGSTALDFAYKIHTTLGDKAVRAKINSKLSKLNTPLKTGDIVEIFEDTKSKGPKPYFLSYAKTKEAKLHIKKRLKKYL